MNNGVKSGLKAAVGKLLSITVVELIEEFKIASETAMPERLKKVMRRVEERAMEIINTFKEFSINAFISTLINTILNSLLKTAKNLLKFIKTAFMSILRAVKVLFSSNYTKEEKQKEALKILGATVATLIGLALEEIIQNALIAAFPPIAGVAGYISPVLSGLIVGVGSVLILQGFQKYQNTIEFRKLKAEEESKLDNMAKINLTQAGVSDIEATESVKVSFSIFQGTLPIIESCRNQIDESLEEIRTTKNLIANKLSATKQTNNENDDLLKMLESF